MAPATISNVRDFIEVMVSAVSVLGVFMAWWSGWAASRSIRANEWPESVAYRVNRGIAKGFEIGLPIAAISLILLAR